MINLSCFLIDSFLFFLLINIHAYANKLVCIFSYYIKDQCLFFLISTS